MSVALVPVADAYVPAIAPLHVKTIKIIQQDLLIYMMR
jgi:hypothetical protein